MKEIFPIIRKNVPKGLKRDFYHELLVMEWKNAIILFILFYLGVNSIFATLYWLDSVALLNSKGSWQEAFFFSVQTLSTIGYGHLAPASTYANVLVTLEATIGVIIIAIMTGFFFAKFSRPHAKINFSKNILITRYNGKPTLMVRMINLRKNQIIDSRLHITVLKKTTSKENIHLRRFLELKLMTPNVPILAMSMTAIHPIDESSPLFGMSEEDVRRENLEFFITAIGTDSTFGQKIHAIQSYNVSDIKWNYQFQDMVTVKEDGTRIVDYSKFHETFIS